MCCLVFYKQKDFVEFINLTGQLHIKYCYSHIQKLVNTGRSITEQIDTDACHPNHDGKMQIADAVYRNLIKEISPLILPLKNQNECQTCACLDTSGVASLRQTSTLLNSKKQPNGKALQRRVGLLAEPLSQSPHIVV